MPAETARTTLNQIAQDAGVSVSTASRILNGPGAERFAQDTRQRVQQAAQRLGYNSPRSARNAPAAGPIPSAPAPRVLAYMYSSYLEVFRPHHDERTVAGNVARGIDFYSQLIIGLQHAMLSRGLQMRLVEALDSPEAQIGFLQNVFPQQVSGLLCSGMLFEQTIDYIRAHHIPTVFIGTSDNCVGRVPIITCDDSQSAFVATRHLIDLGHQRIAFIGDYRCDFTNFQRNRLGGFCQAVLSAGLQVHHDLLFSTDFSEAREVESVVDAMLREPHQVTGVVAGTGLQAIAVINELKRRGIGIPDSISVISVGNPVVADYIDPPLTGVHVPIVTMGAEAVRLLGHYIDQPELPPVSHFVAGNLVLRDSTGSKPRGLEADIEPDADASAGRRLNDKNGMLD